MNGKIYANRYLKNGVAIINPNNGAVEGVIDLSGLKEMVTNHNSLDVLNGIAFNQESKTLFVTGKMWDKIFEIKDNQKIRILSMKSYFHYNLYIIIIIFWSSCRR